MHKIGAYESVDLELLSSKQKANKILILEMKETCRTATRNSLLVIIVKRITHRKICKAIP